MNKEGRWIHKERVPDDPPCKCECMEASISFRQNKKAGDKHWDTGTRKVREAQTTDKQTRVTKVTTPQKEDGKKDEGNKRKTKKSLRQIGVELEDQDQIYLRWLRTQGEEDEDKTEAKIDLTGPDKENNRLL